MTVIAGIHLSVCFHQKGACKLGSKCAFKQTERLEVNQRNGIILW